MHPQRTGDIFPTKDVSKRVLFLPKLLLEVVTLWPEKVNRLSTIVFGIMFLLLVCLGAGQLTFLAKNFDDISKITNSMSTISISFQGLIKIPTLYFYTGTLKNILKKVWYEFWPSDLVNDELEASLKKIGLLALIWCFSMYFAAIVYDFGVLSLPLFQSRYSLPFESLYPFRYDFSPQFEIIYVLQWLTNMYVNVQAICGHDFLFLCLSVNLVVQFRILQAIVMEIGTENEEKLNMKIKEFKRNLDGDLMTNCIKQHKMLLKICGDFNMAFTISSFAQFCCSTVAICVSSFLILMGKIEPLQFIHTSMYAIGHVIQLFLYCVAGNEISYQSRQVSNCLFQSKWYLLSRKSKKKMIFFMLKAQKELELSALHLLPLNYATFLGVLKLSFSFYKLLSTLQEKKLG